MRGRMGRPGLIGMAARTAVVAGTATAVSGNVQRRQANRAQQSADADAYQQQQQQAEYAAQQPQYAAAPAPAAAPAADDLTAQIEKLATLKTAGVISDAEFSAAKAKLLGI
ncbi:SHOCT domain-containing protein [Orlajensenia leifsoniae]|nr:SHOCT domain-containing protein [Leifsonia flava]